LASIRRSVLQFGELGRGRCQSRGRDLVARRVAPADLAMRLSNINVKDSRRFDGRWQMAELRAQMSEVRGQIQLVGKLRPNQFRGFCLFEKHGCEKISPNTQLKKLGRARLKNAMGVRKQFAEGLRTIRFC
jgi:hypothetical protein